MTQRLCLDNSTWQPIVGCGQIAECGQIQLIGLHYNVTKIFTWSITMQVGKHSNPQSCNNNPFHFKWMVLYVHYNNTAFKNDL